VSDEQDPSAKPDAKRVPLRASGPAPVQVPAPDHWPSASESETRHEPVPIGAPLGERPLPEIEPIRGVGLQRPRAKQRAAKPRRPLGRRLIFFAMKAVLVFVLGSVLWVGLYRFVPPPITFTMMGDVFAGHGVTKRWMSLSRTDPDMARAAIAAEDSRFCSHSGFDYKAIAGAFVRNQQGGRIRGGSTISQQTAKNVFLWQGGGYFRKGLEAWFTFLIENLWGKRRIMEVYLNVAETGIGTYGVNAGSIRYFKHDASQMSAREAAQIAAVLPLPKKRAGISPRGFTRRYGSSITARIAVVRNEGLDACLR
jgi:monofunctional glycosyltransferase